jgi:hypothetical protein
MWLHDHVLQQLADGTHKRASCVEELQEAHAEKNCCNLLLQPCAARFG